VLASRSSIRPTSHPYGLPLLNTNYALLASLRKRSTGNRLRKSCTTVVRAAGFEGDNASRVTSNTLPEPYSHGYLYAVAPFVT